MLVVCVIRRRTRSIVVLFALCQEEAEQQHDLPTLSVLLYLSLQNFALWLVRGRLKLSVLPRAVGVSVTSRFFGSLGFRALDMFEFDRIQMEACFFMSRSFRLQIPSRVQN